MGKIKPKSIDRNIAELEELYSSLITTEGEPCIYCGLLATEKEHVIPKSWIDGMKEMKSIGFDVKIPKEIIVASCRECNLIAGCKVFRNFSEKKKFIRERLLKKYAKFTRVQTWRNEEIMELDGRLREQVFIFNEIVKIIKKRLVRLKK